MTQLHLADHLITLVLLVVFPIEGWWEFRRLKERIEAGEAGARLEVYRRAVGRSWAFTLLVLIWWFARDRGATALGFGMPSGPVDWGVLGIAAILVGLLYRQLRAVRRSEESRAEVREVMGSLDFLMPRTDREGHWWVVLSFTAGITEEILYRGFLIFWVGAFVGSWTAALLAGLAFGVAHLYQGVSGILKTGAIGVIMGLLYVWTGNLWAPILLHVAIDAINGAIGRVALGGADEVPAPG